MEVGGAGWLCAGSDNMGGGCLRDFPVSQSQIRPPNLQKCPPLQRTPNLWVWLFSLLFKPGRGCVSSFQSPRTDSPTSTGGGGGIKKGMERPKGGFPPPPFWVGSPLFYPPPRLPARLNQLLHRLVTRVPPRGSCKRSGTALFAGASPAL